MTLSLAKLDNGGYLPGIGALGANCTPTSASYNDLIDDCRGGRHLDGLNMAFADGHVKWLKPDVVSAEASRYAASSAAAIKIAWNPYNSAN